MYNMLNIAGSHIGLTSVPLVLNPEAPADDVLLLIIRLLLVIAISRYRVDVPIIWFS